METLTLPMLDARETVEAACRDLVASRRSGFVLRTSEGMRLIHAKQLHDAAEKGVERLDQIPAYADVAWTGTEADPGGGFFGLPERLTAVSLAGRAGHTGDVSLGRGHGRRMARIAGLNPAEIRLFRSAPGGVICSNPTDPHPYPPYKRDTSRPNECVICASYLP